ncbi:MAG: type II CRISPR RNA-guided endonuclease Cas9 [Gemmataceae bacterium]
MNNQLILGLDLGPNSLGWALLDETAARLVAVGVRVFPEGVDRDQQGGELSKNEQRRIARGMRRQIARRARRKRLLRKALVAAGLLPDVALRPRDDPQRVAWEREQFRQADPYTLRERALRERLEPHEIGRVLLHLNQRRGFLSNRKLDRGRKKETSDMLKEISTLEEDLGDRTLGQYLADIRETAPEQRLRKRHTRRDMYEREFEAIWKAQRQFHPQLLTDVLKYGCKGKQQYPREPEQVGTKFVEHYGLHGVIFFQRPMYWPKSVIGRCELEKREKRCPRADRLAQRFRLLQEVNNLKLLDSSTGEERLLTEEQRSRLIAFLSRAKEKSFADIRKHLELLDHVRFNLERGDRKKLKGMETDALLAGPKLFGKKWHDLPEEKKNEIVRLLLDAQDNKQVEEKFIQLATAEYQLDAQRIEAILDADFPSGHASYSRVAIAKLLPHMEKGLLLMTKDGTPSALSEAGYLRPDQRVVNERPFLPQPPDLANPLVRQALHEVRKVINAIIREHGKPATIHIEMARDVKGTAQERERRTRDMRERERLREDAAKEIRNLGAKVNRDAIDRYLLWEEQRHECIYSGKPISQAQLFSGEVDVDHILPYSRSLDNSLMNRILCFRSENEAKGDRTPYEWLADINPRKFEEIVQRTKYLPYAKAQRFRQQDITLVDFFARQLVDTTYITTQVRDYVSCLGVDVVCTKGQHTAELRHQWGLDTVLRDLPDSPAWRESAADLRPGDKDRSDHRHHAIDAIVIALTNRSRLQQLARLRRRGGSERTGEVLNDPWSHFRADVVAAVGAIHVSHKVLRKIRGALHEETIYGPTAKKQPADPPAERPWAKDWIEDPGQFVYRKPLEALTLPMVKDIRDPVIRRLVIDRLQAHGITLDDGPNKIPAEVWREPLRMPSGVPIKKVRLLRRDATIQPIRQGTAYVKPGSIHHLCIFEYQDERGRTKREAVFVSMLEAIQRAQNKEPIIRRVHPQRPDARFVMSLSANEMVMIHHQGEEALYRFITASSTTGQMWFRHHTVAGKASDKRGVISKQPNTLNARKVTVDPLGRLRWAND